MRFKNKDIYANVCKIICLRVVYPVNVLHYDILDKRIIPKRSKQIKGLLV